MGSTKPEHIQLKDSIAGTLGDQTAIANSPGRTVERDKAAEWLIKNVIDEGEWPLSYGELAERSEWSAGHWRNTYERYFEPAGDGDRGSGSGNLEAESDTVKRELTIYVPSDVDEESFIRGWIAGRNY